jgi:uncharacterized protein YkwD
MNHRWFLAAAVLLAGCNGGIAEQVSTDRLIEMHNEARAGSWWNLKPLTKDAKLTEYAQRWAEKMASSGRMRHSSVRDIMALGFSPAGENIAWGQPNEQAVMSAWLRSPGHRSNIMGSRYTAIGCGASTADGRLYWCVVFGRPQK